MARVSGQQHFDLCVESAEWMADEKSPFDATDQRKAKEKGEGKGRAGKRSLRRKWPLESERESAELKGNAAMGMGERALPQSDGRDSLQ